MDQPLAGDRQAVLGGGHLLAAISTSIVGILREHYGRGPMKAKTYGSTTSSSSSCAAAASRRWSRRSWTAASPTAWSRCARTSSASWPSVTRRRSRSSPAASPRVPQPGPRRARHHDGDLLRRRTARRLRRSRDHPPRSARRRSSAAPTRRASSATSTARPDPARAPRRSSDSPGSAMCARRQPRTTRCWPFAQRAAIQPDRAHRPGARRAFTGYDRCVCDLCAVMRRREGLLLSDQTRRQTHAGCPSAARSDINR